MATESNLWKWLKKAISKDLYMERIENSASTGLADVFGYSRFHGAFYIELKQCPKPKRKNSKLTFKTRMAQIIWHRKMNAVGARTWLLIKIGRENYVFQGSFITPNFSLTMEDSRLINVSKLKPSELIEFLLKYIYEIPE